VIEATLTEFKMEAGPHGDSDYHLVLKDQGGQTMIAEIPSPKCVGPNSPFLARIAQARTQFDTHFNVTGSFQVVNEPVRVTGVGFFDFQHGQRGVAPNAIELHPVLDIEFGGSATLGAGVTKRTARDLLANGSFEQGSSDPSPWITSAKGIVDNSADADAHDGRWKAWLGGLGRAHVNRLVQTVKIPESESSAKLTFWLAVYTEEVGRRAFDVLNVEVRSPSGTLLRRVAAFSNLDAGNGYRQHEYDISDLRGRTVEIVFLAREDTRKATTFLIDDVSLTVN
jgi:hypothetical protein